MLKAILFDLGDTLFDFGHVNRPEVFEQAGRQTYEFLSSKGHSLPPFKKYFSSQVWIVRWAYLWSVLRRREFNVFDLLVKVCDKWGLKFVDATLPALAWPSNSPLTGHTPIPPD